jgi:hypothetical protein
MLSNLHSGNGSPKVPTLGTVCSQPGNDLFPPWEQTVPLPVSMREQFDNLVFPQRIKPAILTVIFSSYSNLGANIRKNPETAMASGLFIMIL